MFEKEKDMIMKACMRMKEYRLISLTGGNISVKIDDDTYIMTPSGMLYEDMTTEDLCVVDHSGKLKDHMPEVRATIHTHQPYATAIGMNNDSLPACMVTLIDANHARINVAPWTKSQDIGMGKLAVEYAGEANTVIMKHHGVISFGKDLEEALYAAVYLEEAAKTYCMARIMGSVPELTDEQIADEAAGWEVYGQ